MPNGNVKNVDGIHCLPMMNAKWVKSYGNVAVFMIMNLRLSIDAQCVEMYSVMLMGLDLHRY